MKKIRYRIAALAGGSVLLTLLLIMAGFNIIFSHKIRSDADYSIRRSVLPNTVEQDDTPLYQPEVIMIWNDNSEPAGQALYTAKECSLIEWCGANSADETRLAEIGGSTYCVLSANADKLMQDPPTGESVMVWYSFGRDEGEELSIVTEQITDDNDLSVGMEGLIRGNIKQMISYVDITGELEMIRWMDLVFLFAALLTGAFGTTMGYFIGKRLEQNQLAQKRFFENTSHELKTPLTSIRGYAEGIENGVITDYAKTGRVIAEQTGKMSALVEEILCMAKLESGSVRLEREDIELTEFLQDCLMPFEGTVLTRGLIVNLDLNEMKVIADPDKLDHAVSNLITNALKFARTEIGISCGNGVIRIENDCEPLSDEVLAHLFDRFYTGRDGNTGIGLSIAKDLIALHGWKLTAERTENGVGFCIKC